MFPEASKSGRLSIVENRCRTAETESALGAWWGQKDQLGLRPELGLSAGVRAPPRALPVVLLPGLKADNRVI